MINLAQNLVTVEVPDCVNPPQPWWQTSGMVPAVWFVAALAVVAIAILIAYWIDGRQK